MYVSITLNLFDAFCLFVGIFANIQCHELIINMFWSGSGSFIKSRDMKEDRLFKGFMNTETCLIRVHSKKYGLKSLAFSKHYLVNG